MRGAEVESLYRCDIDHSNILQTNGCTGANLNALMSVVRPGDHVIAEWPTHASLYEIPRTLGADAEYWRIHEELVWMPGIDELREMIRPDTRHDPHRQRLQSRRRGARQGHARTGRRARSLTPPVVAHMGSIA